MEPNNIYTPEDISVIRIVNKHADECGDARKATREVQDRIRERDARLTRFWTLLTWALYLGAFLVLIWGTWIAIKSALVAPIIGKVAIGCLIALCIRYLYKLAVTFGGDGK